MLLLSDKSQIYTTLKHLTRILKTLWNLVMLSLFVSSEANVTSFTVFWENGPKYYWLQILDEVSDEVKIGVRIGGLIAKILIDSSIGHRFLSNQMLLSQNAPPTNSAVSATNYTDKCFN